MTLLRLFILIAFLLFSLIFAGTWLQDREETASPLPSEAPALEEIELKGIPIPAKKSALVGVVPTFSSIPTHTTSSKKLAQEEPPEVDIVEELFKKGSSLPFIETISYKSRVPWQKGRPAWLSDYAAHYETSRHFIARSLNGKADYFKQDLVEGDTFNIYRPDVDLTWYLLVDASRKKLWLFAIDRTHNKRSLIKSYPVCLGRVTSSRTSGSLTPSGVYSLGSRVAIYKPKVMGFYQGKKTEMIRVFGTRWIPFEKEISSTTSPAKGFGIHGVPWTEGKNGQLVEDDGSIGKNESDGCIRLRARDIEEIYALVAAKRAEIEIVENYFDAELFAKKRSN